VRPTVNAAPSEVILNLNGGGIYYQASVKDWWIFEFLIGEVISPVIDIGGREERDYQGHDLATYAKSQS